MMAELNASYMPHKLAGPLLAETSFCGESTGRDPRYVKQSLVLTQGEFLSD